MQRTDQNPEMTFHLFTEKEGGQAFLIHFLQSPQTPSSLSRNDHTLRSMFVQNHVLFPPHKIEWLYYRNETRSKTRKESHCLC